MKSALRVDQVNLPCHLQVQQVPGRLGYPKESQIVVRYYYMIYLYDDDSVV